MKSRIIRRTASIMLAFAMMICMIGADFCVSLAKDTTGCSIELPGTMWMGQNAKRVHVYDSAGKEMALDSLTLSDSSVLKVRKDKYKDEAGKTHYDFDIDPAKLGKTKVTAGFVGSDGKEKSVSTNVCVKDYPKEIKRLKVNGKKVKTANYVKRSGFGTVDQRFEYHVRSKKATVRVKLSTKKGWEIIKIDSNLSIGYGDTYRNYDKVVTKKKIIKGKSFKFPKKYDDLFITVTMKNKSGEKIDYLLHMYR